MNIKSFIIERGLSVKQVADNMGISSPALSQLLSGNPTVQKIQDIAEKGIGCKRWELFADEMDVKDVLERFKDQFEEEIQRRVAAGADHSAGHRLPVVRSSDSHQGSSTGNMKRVLLIIVSVAVVSVSVLSLGWGGTAAVAILASLRA